MGVVGWGLWGLGDLCKEVTEGWGLAIEIVMVGWVNEKEAGCKGRHCCVCEKSWPSGDEGGGSCMAQRCRVFRVLVRARLERYTNR